MVSPISSCGLGARRSRGDVLLSGVLMAVSGMRQDQLEERPCVFGGQPWHPRKVMFVRTGIITCRNLQGEGRCFIAGESGESQTALQTARWEIFGLGSVQKLVRRGQTNAMAESMFLWLSDPYRVSRDFWSREGPKIG